MSSKRTFAIALELALFLLGAGAFAALVWRAGPSLLWQRLTGFGWGLPLLLLPSLVIFVVDCWGWKLCFRDPPPVGFLRLFLVRTAGESLNATLPAGTMGGEPVKAMLLRRAGVPGAEGLASAIVARTSMTAAQMVFVLAGIASALLASEGADSLPAVVSGVALVTGILISLIYMFYKAQTYGLGRLLGAFLGKVRIGHDTYLRHRTAFQRFDEVTGDYWKTHRLQFWAATAIFFGCWCMESVELAIFAHLLELNLAAPTVIAISSLATAAKAAGFFIPASLGAQEGGNVLLFVVYGFDQVIGMTYSLVKRFRELFWIGLGLTILGVLSARGDLRPPDKVTQ